MLPSFAEVSSMLDWIFYALLAMNAVALWFLGKLVYDYFSCR